jgi:hypothetical protein
VGCGSPRPLCAKGGPRSVFDDSVLAQNLAGFAGDELVLDLAHAAGRRGVGIAFSIDGEAADQTVLHDGEFVVSHVAVAAKLHAGDPDARAVADMTEQEISLMRGYADVCGYEFFVFPEGRFWNSETA